MKEQYYFNNTGKSIAAAYTSDFQPFSSHGNSKLIAKMLWYTKNMLYFFANMTKIGIILIYSHQMALLCWLLSFFSLGNLREKSVPLTKY